MLPCGFPRHSANQWSLESERAYCGFDPVQPTGVFSLPVPRFSNREKTPGRIVDSRADLGCLAVFLLFSFHFPSQVNGKKTATATATARRVYIKKQENRENTQATRSHRQNGMKSLPMPSEEGGAVRAKPPNPQKTGGLENPKETPNSAEKREMPLREN